FARAPTSVEAVADLNRTTPYLNNTRLGQTCGHILQLSVLQFVDIQIVVRPFLRGDSRCFLFFVGLVTGSGFLCGCSFLSARYGCPGLV
uniref:Uncharacterized protein n=2 Tax=Aegilops tauschii subsp. strangulata TaxID=200361 RepID=A0A453PY10_AEGTS